MTSASPIVWRPRLAPHLGAGFAPDRTSKLPHQGAALNGPSRGTRHAARAGFTVLELLTTIALFVVVMGLMVSLARYVRSNSADQLTRAILIDLERDMAEYFTRFNAYPPAPAPPDNIDEKSLANAIESANTPLATLLTQPLRGLASDPLDAPLSLRDAWGRGIGYLPGHHPLVGMAPQNRPFFFSAGPDGLYLTRQDNLYSYEQSHPGQSPGVEGSQAGVDKANNPTGGD